VSLALHWFRTDLRVHDNLALSAAQAAGPVAALYIATPRQWRAHDDAPVKQDYWRRNLQVLEAELRALGIPLLYFEVPLYRDIPVLFARLLPALQVGALHCNRELPVNEQLRDTAVQTVCTELGVRMTLHDDRMLVAPERVLNKSGEPFKVFTPYARAMREVVQQGTPPLAAMQGQQEPVFARLPERRELRELSWPALEPTWERYWPAGESVLRKQLDTFCEDRIDAYRTQRDIPSVNGTSRLSPALAAGVLSVRECWRRSMQQHDGEGALTWQNELLWRDFYQYIVWHYPRVCKKLPWKQDVAYVPWRHDEKEFALWCEGRTGIPIVDAALRQLQQTGWMHNRLRMLAAMFLTKHLLIDWRWGERWFMQNLVDGDLAANNGGWQWSASTGTDAAPYFRIFNPVTQSRRFDPDGTFIRQYLPELAHLDKDSIHDPGLLRPASYPAPMIDLAFGRERALNAFKIRGQTTN
jgi:deoxyribodipyrimidine photo-lyase